MCAIVDVPSYPSKMLLKRKKIEVDHMATPKFSDSSKPDFVQVKNPKTGHYVKIDRSVGKIVSHKKSKGRYKGVPVATKRK